MALQYRCDDDRRRLAAVRAHPVLNGIEVLEVLDHDAPPGIPRQQSLLVSCVKEVPDDLSRENARIDGGVRPDPRLNPVRVLWAAKASAVATLPTGATLTAADQAFFPGLPDADHVLVVRTDRTGDLSTYRLRLVRSPNDDRPLDGFDPILSEVPFSFKVECPTDFDCKVDAECPEDALPEPTIDYLAKDYESFRGLLLDRLALTMPSWTERSPADLGMTLVELLAFLADQVSYFQDAVATEAYLGSARRRVSVRRHARLLDYPMHDGCNARAWLAVEVTPGGDADGAQLERGTPVVTGDDSGLPTLSPDDLAVAVSRGAIGFETLHGIRLEADRNEIQFHTWGRLECCLPPGATRATLRDTAGGLGLREGDVLVFEEVVGPSGLEVDANPEHRHVVRLDADPEPDVDPLTGDRVLEISWHPADALPFPLCLDQFPVPGGVVRGASVARGNVVLADHGLTGAPEPLPPVPETGRYAPVLARPGLTFRMPYDDETARAAPASAATAVDVHLTVPAIRLSQGADRWEPQRDLLSSDRFANEFVVETESDGRAGLRFGDDVLGRRPTPGAAFRAQYRVGNGAAGNVGREALGRLVTNLRDFDRVGNPVAAAGGTEPESLEEVRQFAPQAFRRQERAVTEADYAEVAERHPEIQRAAATRRWTGSWYTEFVAVDRRGGYGVDERFAAAMAGFLEPFRMAGRDVEVDGPVDVPLDIAMTVCVEPDQLRADVQRALLEAFGRGQLPGGGRGFFHPDNFTFGQPVYLSRVVARAMDVPGVQWVDTSEGPDSANRFQRWGQDSHGERDAGVIEMGRLEVARLDNDPDAPEEGRIEFVMQGGLG